MTSPPMPPNGTRHEFRVPTPLYMGRIHHRAAAIIVSDIRQAMAPTRRL